MIIIKTEMEELPHNCFQCPFGQNGRVWKYDARYDAKFVEYHYSCAITNKSMTSTKRNRFCPLEVAE